MFVLQLLVRYNALISKDDVGGFMRKFHLYDHVCLFVCNLLLILFR